MKPTLPQNDPKPDHRRQALSAQGKDYTYDYEVFEGIAYASEVPPQDNPSIEWGMVMGESVLDALVNMAHVQKDAEKKSRTHDDHIKLLQVLKQGGAGGLDAIYDHYKDYIGTTALAKVKAASVADYEALFETLPKPAATRYWNDDRNFSWMRLAGPNPMSIAHADAVPDHFPVTDAHFKAAMKAHTAWGLEETDDSLDAAKAEGRLFLVDHGVLDQFNGGTYPHGVQKYLPAPIALFAASRDSRTLVPVAIQCGVTPSDEFPIFTPADKQWTLAKLAVSCADGNYHQAVSHLAHTHLVTEPVVIAARRNLAPDHPLGHLLYPHHEGTLAINRNANDNLIAPTGSVDSVLSGDIASSRGAAALGVQIWDFNANMAPTLLHARGLMNTDTLPENPYRDDALLVWYAIHDWVESYLRLYYRSDEDVRLDTELQAFIAELGAADGGRIKNVGQQGRVRTLRYLIDAVTHMIFTVSAQHAAVNFPQWDQMTFTPNLPLAAYAPPPTRKDTDVDALLLRTLPPLDMAEYQQVLGVMLGKSHYTKLGEYHHTWHATLGHDPRVKAPLKDFQNRLREVELLIHERNLSRWQPYEYLLPTQIPQSINV